MLIDDRAVKYFRKWFIDYVSSFKNAGGEDKRNIILKEEHTFRVCEEIVNLGRQLGLKDEDLCLAELVALFHDIGRFEQYARYKTFADKASEDHALLGVRILRDKAVLADIDEPSAELILRAVSYHNKVSLPADESDQCLFFSKLVRDADKLDILLIVTDYYRNSNNNRNEAVELHLPDTPGISRLVYDDIASGHTVNANNMNNLNDFKLLQLSWVFDINFTPALREVHKREYLDLIRASLPETEEIKNIFIIVMDFMRRTLFK